MDLVELIPVNVRRKTDVLDNILDAIEYPENAWVDQFCVSYPVSFFTWPQTDKIYT